MQALENRKGRTLTGIVVSDKNDKTIVVRVLHVPALPLCILLCIDVFAGEILVYVFQ